jgi:hypothetical protein
MVNDGMPIGSIGAGLKPADFTIGHRVRRPDTLQFRTLEGTCRMSGVPAYLLRRLIAKEITDNALDACDRAGCPGIASIGRDGDTYTVTDMGGGIGSDPATLADLFSTERAMLSGKYWRTISRGVLGNGLRVMVAAVALSGGTITVESQGRRTVLRPRRIGETHIAEQTLSDVSAAPGVTFSACAIAEYRMRRSTSPPCRRLLSPPGSRQSGPVEHRQWHQTR